MAISFISAASAAGNTVSMPTHQAGDLIICFAYRDGNTLAPTKPSGWVNAGSTGGNSNSAIVGLKIAESSSEVTGTWTNATGVVVHVYRGAVGASVTFSSGLSSTISYPAKAIQDPGISWAAGFAGHRSATNLTTNTPSGGLNTPRTGVATEVRGLDSGGPIATSTYGTQSVDASSGWMSASVEIMTPALTSFDTLSDDFNTGTDPDSGRWIVENSLGTGTVTLSGGCLVCATGPASSICGITMNGDDRYLLGGTMQIYLVSASGPLGYPFIAVSAMGVIGWLYTSGNMYAQYADGSVGSAISSPAGKWFRVRESSGTVHWEYSSDSISWSSAYSTSTQTALAICSRASLSVGYLADYGSGAVSMTVDDFNIMPNSGAFFQFF